MVRLLALTLVLAALPAATASAAARDCGVVGRQFTDGGALVKVTKGKLKCATAKSLLRRYWGQDVAAFTERRTVRHAGIRWTCRPTTDDFPYRWACTGGGPERDRYRVTAVE